MSEILADRLLFRDGTVMGAVVQSVLTNTSALQSITTTIPRDDTIPTSSEGAEVTGLTTSFTPRRVGNKIRVTVNLFYGGITQINIFSSLFKNSEASALAVAGQCSVTNLAISSLMYRYEETVTDLNAITFKVRLGPESASTVYLNGIAAARVFGGKATSSILIEEIQA